MNQDPQIKSQPGEFWLEGLHLGWIEEDLEYIRFIHSENKALQEIREKYQDDPMMVIVCREILFENARHIELLTERIEDAKQTVKAIRKRTAAQESE